MLLYNKTGNSGLIFYQVCKQQQKAQETNPAIHISAYSTSRDNET